MTALVCQRKDLSIDTIRGLVSRETLRRSGIVTSRVLERRDDGRLIKAPVTRRYADAHTCFYIRKFICTHQLQTILNVVCRKLCRKETLRQLATTRCNFIDWHQRFVSWIKTCNLTNLGALWVNGDETAIDLTIRDQFVWADSKVSVDVPGW